MYGLGRVDGVGRELAHVSDIFTFIAPVMPRRRAEPFAVKLAASGLVMFLLTSAFATFVVAQEHSADARHAALEARAAAEEQANANRLASITDAAGTDPAAANPVPGVAKLLDGQARDAAERALAFARGALGRGDLGAAGVAQLADADPTLLFIEGASTAPTIVSVALSGGTWAAAVMGPSGACYGVSLDTQGVVRYDRSRPCTGQAALAAAGAAW